MTFTVYVLSSPDNLLTAEKTFVALSLFLLLRAPMQQLPTVIGSSVQLYVSHQRLYKFLTQDELQLYSHNENTAGRGDPSKHKIFV